MLDAETKHQLHYLNKAQAWYQPSPVVMKSGEIPAAVRKLAAILAAAGALMAFEGGHTLNEAAEAQTAHLGASNKWSHYQAKSIRQALSEDLLFLVSDESKTSKLKEKAEKYKADKEKIYEEAREFEEKAKEAEKKAEHAMKVHNRWAQGSTGVSVAVALSAVALLSQRKWMAILSAVVGVVAIGLGVSGLF